MEEISLCFRCWKDGKPAEHFLVIHVTSTDDETIPLAITTHLQETQIDDRCMRGMGFDGACTFSRHRTGVQARLGMLSPFAIVIHYINHMLQLEYIQAANQVLLVKRVYSKPHHPLDYYSPKRAENLEQIQAVLNMPQLKMLKPTDTRWLSHENTIRSVKIYIALVVSNTQRIR